MNLTLHIIRKDLRALRWWLLVWVLACLTHLGLRLAQLSRGDGVPVSGFWKELESTNRPDHIFLFALPLLLIPLLLHTDSLFGWMPFWKTIPASRSRMLTAKFVTLAGAFVLLPLICEVVYFSAANLNVVLAAALGDWAARFLPVIVVPVLASLFARNLLVAVPLVAAAAGLSAIFFQTPFGPRMAMSRGFGSGMASRIIPPPSGSRIELLPQSLSFQRVSYRMEPKPGEPSRTEERLRLDCKVRTAGLPPDVLVSSATLASASIQWPGESVQQGSNQQAPHHLFFSHGNLPLAEQRDEFGGNNRADSNLPKDEWELGSENFSVAAKDIPSEGALVEVTARVSLLRRRLVATLPLVEGAEWVPGVHRLSLSNVAGPNESRIRFRGALKTILADPRGDTGGLQLQPHSSFAIWLENQSRPQRKHVHFVSAEAWRKGGMGIQGSWSGSAAEMRNAEWTDVTRSRKLSEFIFGFDPAQVVQQDWTPLAAARYAEEQAQVRNWKVVIYAYDDLGTVELPLKAVVARPRDGSTPKDDEDRPAPPPLDQFLTNLQVPENPDRKGAEALINAVAEVASRHKEDTLRRHESVMMLKLAALGPQHIETMVAAAAEAGRSRREYESPPRHRQEWLRSFPEPSVFWRRVLRVAADLARPEDKDLILRLHTPHTDLLRAIEPHGWEQEALASMCSFAQKEPVPPLWQECMARHPGPLTQSALLQQIRLRAVPEMRAASFIASGAIPPREAADALWETAVANSGAPWALQPSFAFAVQYGAELVPRDLARILRLPAESWIFGERKSHRKVLSLMTQAFSVRSNCPPDAAQASAWLEQNAMVARWEEKSARHLISGESAPPDTVASAGKFVTQLGGGTAQMEGSTITLSTAGIVADYSPNPMQQSAPRLMREVEGDFTAEVTVDSHFNPGQPSAPNGGIVFQSAGLIVEGGPGKMLRFEKGVYQSETGHQLREEISIGGKNNVHERAAGNYDPSRPVRIRISRKGDLLWTAWQQGDGGWTEHAGWHRPGWSLKSRVALAVFNTTTSPTVARFSDWKLEKSASPPAGSDTEALAIEGATADGTPIEGWGVVENPTNSGAFSTEGNVLRVTVGPRHSDFNIQQRMTAPRVMNELEGDFTAEVTLQPPPAQQWNSASLLVVAGLDFQYRLGIDFGWPAKHTLATSYVENGRPAGAVSLDAPRDLTKPLRVRLQRRGWFLHVAQQQGDGPWVTFYPLNLRAWPAKWKVGVVAGNTSGKPVTQTFSDFKLARP